MIFEQNYVSLYEIVIITLGTKIFSEIEVWIVKGR
jgi:hypothetical protein